MSFTSPVKNVPKSPSKLTGGSSNPSLESVSESPPTAEIERPLDEMVVVHRSSPIRSPVFPKETTSSSSSDELDRSYPQKKILRSPRVRRIFFCYFPLITSYLFLSDYFYFGLVTLLS